MIKTRTLRQILTSSLLFFCGLSASHANLILTAPPRESVEAGVKIYQPIADYLSQLLGEKVLYQHPDSWRNYKKKMQANQYDIVFDGPHFAAWRIENLGHSPAVKLPGQLDFILVTKKDDNKIETVKDLIGHRICTLPPPNLGGLTVYGMFPNPARQPHFVLLKGGFKNVAKQFLAGECRAAILRGAFFKKKLSEQDRARMKPVRQSNALTNQGITISKRVSKKNRVKIIRSLSSQQGRAALQPLFDRFSKKSTAMVVAHSTDYTGHNLLRDNMIYGW